MFEFSFWMVVIFIWPFLSLAGFIFVQMMISFDNSAEFGAQRICLT